MTTAAKLAKYPLTEGVNPWLIALAVMSATFMEVLDTSIASVALRNIAGSMSASVSEATWVLTSYLVANAVILPASNWFALRFGRKKFLITCVIIFTASSLMCGAAPTLWFLLLARVLQGAGGGALQPLSQSILMESFPPARRAAAMAAFAFGIVVAPVIGPTLGGWLTDTYSWRYAFYINIPIGILSVILISRFIHDPSYVRNAKVGKFDNIGFGLLAIWTATLQIVLDKGQEDDWFGALWIRYAVVAMVAALGLWIYRSWTRTDSLVNLRILKDWNFRTGCMLMWLLGVTVYSTITLLPLYFQEVMGYTAYQAGWVVGPRGFGAICAMPIVGIIGNKIDSRKLLTFGFLLFFYCALYFGRSNLSIGPTTMLIPIVVSGFAMSFVFVPMSTISYTTLKNSEMGNATGIFNLMRNIGGSVGISAVQTMLVRRQSFYQSQIGSNLTGTNDKVQQSLRGIGGYLGSKIGPPNSGGGAMGTLYMMLQQQALLSSFVVVFRWVALLSIISAVLVWTFKKNDLSKAPPPGVH
jgi:DHA2 family multidrug resistance protein